MNKRNQYSAEFKSQVVIEVLCEEETVNEIAAKRGINPVMIPMDTRTILLMT